MKKSERNRGAKGFEKVEGGVVGCGCCTQETALCLGLALARFVYLFPFVFCVSVSIQAGPSPQCPFSTQPDLGSW